MLAARLRLRPMDGGVVGVRDVIDAQRRRALQLSAVIPAVAHPGFRIFGAEVRARSIRGVVVTGGRDRDRKIEQPAPPFERLARIDDLLRRSILDDDRLDRVLERRLPARADLLEGTAHPECVDAPRPGEPADQDRRLVSLPGRVDHIGEQPSLASLLGDAAAVLPADERVHLGVLVDRALDAIEQACFLEGGDVLAQVTVAALLEGAFSDRHGENVSPRGRRGPAPGRGPTPQTVRLLIRIALPYVLVGGIGRTRERLGANRTPPAIRAGRERVKSRTVSAWRCIAAPAPGDQARRRDGRRRRSSPSSPRSSVRPGPSPQSPRKSRIISSTPSCAGTNRTGSCAPRATCAPPKAACCIPRRARSSSASGRSPRSSTRSAASGSFRRASPSNGRSRPPATTGSGRRRSVTRRTSDAWAHTPNGPQPKG